MREALQITLGVAAAALIGTAYVLVHEQRRKGKAERKALRAEQQDAQANIPSKEKLIAILRESADAIYQLIQQTRKMVYIKHETTGMSLEDAANELQQGLEPAMQAVMASIRTKHAVSEEQVTQANALHGADADVQEVVRIYKEVMLNGTPPPEYGKETEPKKPPRRKAVRRKG